MSLTLTESTSTGIASFPDDYLPPERVYESRDALFKSINI